MVWPRQQFDRRTPASGLKLSAEVRDLIRRTNLVKPVLPRICGELLNFGGQPSHGQEIQPWRLRSPPRPAIGFCRTRLTDISVIDMFVIATASFGFSTPPACEERCAAGLAHPGAR